MTSLLLIAAAAAASIAAQPRAVLEDHPTIRFSDKTFVLGRMRWDLEHRGPRESLAYTEGDIAFRGKDQWGFVRRRFSVEGNIAGKLAFEIETDLSGTERWKDVYAEYMEHSRARVRAGKFVIPFSYERTTSIDVLDFAYRSMGATHLVPPRDRGVMVFGDLAGRTLTYEAGWFEDGDTLAGRVTLRPFRGFETGTGVTYGELGNEIAALRGTTALGVPFFSGGRLTPGHRRRFSVHGVYRAGSGAVKAEFLANDDNRDDLAQPLSVPEGGVLPAALFDLDARAWYASASYVVTGESEASAHQPRRPLGKGGIGSIELAARTEELKFSSSGLERGRARAHTVGVNWQPTRWFRVQWNAIRDAVHERRTWTRVLRFHLTI